MSKLVIFRGDAVETEIALTGATVRIGRDSRNDAVLDDKSVSRFHAEVRAEAGAYVIVDLKSRNGVWLNRQQIKGKAALTLGVPVTVGAYELALEDDVSTGDFGETPMVAPTVVSPAHADRPDRPRSRSAAPRSLARSSRTGATRPALLWSGLVLATLLVCGVTYFGVRYMVGPQETTFDPPAPPPRPAGNLPLGDPGVIELLAEARAALDRLDYAVVRDLSGQVLYLDPDNQEALDLKQQADAGLSKSVVSVGKSEPKDPEVTVTPGIPVRPGESAAVYIARVARIRDKFRDAMSSLDKEEFGRAISDFESVAQDQPGYNDVESLIGDAKARRQKAVDEAIDSGQQNEQAGKLSAAQQWFERALHLDGSSTIAREKLEALTNRMTKDGLAAFEEAEVLRKRRFNSRAIPFYKQAADLLPSNHEKHREAQQWLENLKP